MDAAAVTFQARSEPDTAVLRALLFKAMSIRVAGNRIALPKMRKTRAVFAILALRAPEPVSRVQLTALLWSRRDPQQARASLRQALHELHAALGPETRHFLEVDRSHLALSGTSVWVDVGALRILAAARQGEALALYQPPLLEDLDGIDPAFDRWLGAERQGLALLARELGEALLSAANEPPEALAAAGRLLDVDPAHEGAWRATMRSYAAMGDRAAAADAFARCKRALADHAALVPSTETADLAEALRDPRRQPGVSDAAPQSGNCRGLPPPTRHSGQIRIGILPPRALGPGLVGELSLGLAEEITTALAPFRWLSCVSSSSLATIAGESREASVAWRELRLDFLLEGTIQQGHEGVRIMARLLDMHAADEVIWAHRFDRQIDDVLALQDEIASAIVAQIAPELLLLEGKRAAARRLADPTSHDLMLRAIPAIYRLDEVGFRAAGQMLEEAIDLDTGNAAAHAWLAHWYIFFVGQGWAADADAAVRRACLLAERAVTLDPSDARALSLAGHVRGFLDRRPREALALHERALAINPNLALAWCLSGLTHCYIGELDEAIRRIRQAKALSPYDPHGFFFDMALIMPYLLRREHEVAAGIGRRAIELNPICSSSYKVLLAALGYQDRAAEARSVRARLLELEPGLTVAAAIRRSPLTRQEDLDHYAEGLRRAGLPEGEAGPGVSRGRSKPRRQASPAAAR